MHPILDHTIISERYFYPQRAALSGAVMVETPEGPLACWRSAPPSNKPVVVHFHGNGELVHHWIPDFVPSIQKMGYEVFLAEYRGYGASAGKPRLGAMLNDVSAIVKAVGVPPQHMVAFGRSVGSIYAIEMAHRFPEIAGLVLESGIADVLQRLLLRMEPQELGCTPKALKDAVLKHLDHQTKLKGFQQPLLVLHAEGDNLVTIDHAEANYRWSASLQKKFVRFERGDHNSILAVNYAEYLQEVHGFLAAVRPLTTLTRLEILAAIEQLESLRQRRLRGLDDGRFVRDVIEEMDAELKRLKTQLASMQKDDGTP